VAEGFKIGDGFIDVEAKVDRDRFEERVRGAMGGLPAIGATAGRALVGALLAGLALSNVSSFVAALAPLVGVLVALPAVALAGGAALGVLKIALSGVGDAVSAGLSGDTAKFDAALKGLAPSAQATARAIVGLKPALDSIKAAVQQRFFQDLGQQVEALGTRYLPLLQTRLPQVAGALAGFATNFANAARSGPLFAGVNAVLDGTTIGLARLNDAVAPLTNALGNLFLAGAPAAQGLLSSIGALATRFAEFINAAAGTGQLTAWLRGALSTASTLGAIIANVGSILGAVFGAAASTGGNLLTTLLGLTDQVSAFLRSVQGASALVAIFGAVRAFGDALGTALGAVLPALGQALTALAPAIGPLAAGLAQVVVAVAPLLPIVGQLAAVLAGQLASVITALVPVVTMLAGAFGALGSFLTQYAGWIMPVVAGVVAMVTAFKLMTMAANAFKLVMVAVRVAMALTPFGAIVAGLTLLVGAFLYAWNTSETFRNVVRGVLRAVQDAFAAFMGFVRGIPAFFSGLWANITGAVSAGVSAVVGFFQDLPGRVLGALVTLATAYVGLWRTVLTTAATLIMAGLSAVGSFFAALPGRILAGLVALPGLLGTLFTTTLNAVAYAIGYGIGTVIKFWMDLPGRIVSAITTLGPRVIAVFTAAFTAARAYVSAGIAAVVGFYASLPGRAASAVASLWGRMTSAFTAAVNGARSAATNLVNGAASLIASLPGRAASGVASLWGRIAGAFSAAVSGARTAAMNLVNGFVSGVAALPGRAASALSSVRSSITGAFAGAGSWLVSAGADILHGLAAGIRSAVGSAVQAAKDAVGSVVSGAKSALGINSPSRVFRDQVGVGIPEGIAVGITRATPEMTRALDDALGMLPRNAQGPAVALGAVSGAGYAGGPAGAGSAAAMAGGMHVENLTVELRADDLRQVLDMADLLDTITRKARSARPGLVGVNR
jgi:phage-related protein